MTQRTLSMNREQAFSLIESGKIVSSTSWKHGHRDDFVFKYGKRLWMVSVDVHPSEGWQIFGTLVAREVIEQEVKRVEYIPWEAPSNAEDLSIVVTDEQLDEELDAQETP